ncbi:MAG: winged helix-turn-helix domain-containing protein [Halobacteria archaeon]|nr:winged helix-turn-helix domain-containing protein [Halobacteria archaeon]
MSSAETRSINLGKRRSSIEIMMDIMRAALQQDSRNIMSDGGAPINQRGIMRSANLNHSQLKSHLELLEQKEFVIMHDTDAGTQLEITDKGREFLDRAEMLCDILN